GELVFNHNAQGSQYILPITLYVRESGPRDLRVLDLRRGWNIVSLNIAPAESLLTPLVGPLVDAGILLMIKDGRGRFFRPNPPFNNIPYWDARQGYQIYIAENFRWSVLGTAIPADSTIPLIAGWNLVSFLPRVSLPAPLALRSIEDNLVVAKDPNGRFYLPEFEFSNMENMREGRGYFIKVTDETELIYPIGQGVAQLLHNESFVTPRHFLTKNFSGSNFSLLTLGSSHLKGWEIGVRDQKGVLRGGGVVDSQGRCGIAVWEITDNDTIDASSPLFLVAWDGEREINITGDPVAGKLDWEPDGWAVVKLNDAGFIPAQLTLYELYPNPFNTTIRFSVGLPPSHRELKMTIYDCRGAVVRQAVHSSLSPGIHHFTWSLSDLPGGIYFLRLEHESHQVSAKLLLIK
ncbi:MAG: T9SS type A sorting domain-containing protein, partial [bacterium]